MEEGYGEGRWRVYCALMGFVGDALFGEAMGRYWGTPKNGNGKGKAKVKAVKMG
jgi:hypothetical protein